VRWCVFSRIFSWTHLHTWGRLVFLSYNRDPRTCSSSVVGRCVTSAAFHWESTGSLEIGMRAKNNQLIKLFSPYSDFSVLLARSISQVMLCHLYSCSLALLVIGLFQLEPWGKRLHNTLALKLFYDCVTTVLRIQISLTTTTTVLRLQLDVLCLTTTIRLQYEYSTTTARFLTTALRLLFGCVKTGLWLHN